MADNPKVDPLAPYELITQLLAHLDKKRLDWMRKDEEEKRQRDAQFADFEQRFHPAGTKAGIMEQLIKMYGSSRGALIPEDIPYLEQYLHPEHDVLPRTDKRPTRAAPRDMAYRELARHPTGDLNTEGLGHSQRTMGTGASGPYRSYYDVWDFNTESELGGGMLDPIAKAIMERVGKPFVAYNREPFSTFGVEVPRPVHHPPYPGPQDSAAFQHDYEYDDFLNPEQKNSLKLMMEHKALNKLKKEK